MYKFNVGTAQKRRMLRQGRAPARQLGGGGQTVGAGDNAVRVADAEALHRKAAVRRAKRSAAGLCPGYGGRKGGKTPHIRLPAPGTHTAQNALPGVRGVDFQHRAAQPVGV